MPPVTHDRREGSPGEGDREARPKAGAAPSLRVLVVDDEQNIRRMLTVCLRNLGCEVDQAASGSTAIERLRRRPFDLALLDLRLDRESGLDVLPRMLSERPELEVVVITAYATVDSAVEAMRRGAKDYQPKPFTPAQIAVLVERTAARRALERRLAVLEAKLDANGPGGALEVRSPRMQQALRLLDRAAPHDVPVLLRGESGTGKVLLAHELHARSPRRDRSIAVVRCAATSEDALLPAIFGTARAAASAGSRAPGAIEATEGGTLVLDEIGEASLDVQARLLRLLRDHEFERVGETRPRTADVRVVATTRRDLEADVKAGRFRPELLYGLAVMEIHVPPLRERNEDLLPLARHLLAALARKAGRAVPALSPEAERALTAYPWPGNVPELRNTIERALIVTPGEEIQAGSLPERIATSAGGGDATVGGDFTAEQVEREHVLRVLARSAKLEDASRILGVDVTTLWRKRKKWGR